MDTDWAKIITAVVAIYGAILSTYNLWVKRQETRVRLKVDLSMGFLAGRSDVSRSDWLLILTAANPSKRPIIINIPTILIPGKNKLFNPNVQSEKTFPCELQEGHSCKAWFSAREIATALAGTGYRGKVVLIGEFHDAIGTEYKSKPLKFKIEDWLK